MVGGGKGTASTGTGNHSAMSDQIISAVWDVSPEQRFFGSLLDDDYGFARGASSGVRITSENAFKTTVVMACVRVLAETVASLPVHAYQRLASGGKDRYPGWLDTLLSIAPNAWMTSFEWRETSMIHLGLYGNCYSEICPGPAGTVAELVPLHPSRMKVERIENGRLRYTYTEPSGAKTVYNQDQIFHVRWMSNDGIVGQLPIELGKEAIGLARACEMHGARYFGNGARPGIVLETDGNLAAEAAERLRENWERMHRGPDKSSKTAVLTGGLKAHELGSTNTDSQFLEARRFQVEEICRLYRVPPHMVQDLSRATFSNIEQQSIDFTQGSILPWLRRFEAAFTRDLIAQPDKYFVEFDVRGLLRGDAAARSQYLSSMIDRGVMSVNEARAAESLNPVEGGDQHFFPLNMTTVERMAAEPVAPAEEEQPTEESPAEESQPASAPTGTPDTVEQNFAAAALNGAQITSLLEVLANIASGLLTSDGASAVLAASFPQLSSQQVSAIIAGVKVTAPVVQPVAGVPNADPATS
jgi:HK97 family phage portal protein